MPKIEPFELFTDAYEKWFVDNKQIYELELETVKQLLPPKSRGLEVGVGSGRFAAPLGIKTGIEPSPAMAKIARNCGIEVIDGVAEKLPFKDDEFDFVLLVTTICFVDDIEKTFSEAYRVLKKNGCVIVGFVDKNSSMGKKYLAKKDKSKFYNNAVFFSSEDVLNHLSKAGFNDFEIKQTILSENENILIKDGFGDGSFVVIKGKIIR